MSSIWWFEKMKFTKGIVHLLIPLIIIGSLVGAFFGFQYLNKSKSSQTSTIRGGKMYKVGVFQQSQKIVGPGWDGFKKGMKDLEYVEEKNITYVYKDANGQSQNYETIANELAQQDFDMIYATGATAGVTVYDAVKKAGRETPIVFSILNEPEKRGIAKSLKSSGTNVTGVTVDYKEVTAKKFELLKKINPNAKRVGVFTDGFMVHLVGKFILDEVIRQAPNFGLTIVEYKYDKPVFTLPEDEFTKIFHSVTDPIKPGDIDAVMHIAGHNTKQDVLEPELERRLKIPGIGINGPEVELGMMYAYSPDLFAIGEQSAVIADKILKGTKPTDIPIEYGKRNELIINLKAARDIEYTFPKDILEISNVKVK